MKFCSSLIPRIAALLGLLFVVSIAPAAAQGNGYRVLRPIQENRVPRGSPQGVGSGAYSQPPASVQTTNQPPDRLSPEERLQLRRDINAAGRDIYRRDGGHHQHHR